MKALKVLTIITLAVGGLFASTPALASANSTNEVVAQATPANTHYYEETIPGNIKDSVFRSINIRGYQYRGYITLQYVVTNRGYYSGYLYRAPLPYPIY